MLYLTSSFNVVVAVQIFLQCITSTWSSLQRLWHLYIICMMQIEILVLFMEMRLSFVRFTCCFILILTPNPWLISTSSVWLIFFCILKGSFNWVLNMWIVTIFHQKGESLSLWFRFVLHPIIRSKEMCFARSVLRYNQIFAPFGYCSACGMLSFSSSFFPSSCFGQFFSYVSNRFYQMGNYMRFFSTISAEASYLQYCILERYINKVMISISFLLALPSGFSYFITNNKRKAFW
jgi:hypothetical protein